MYTINEIAKISGLTTRTLRSYLKSGLLEGEKKGGVWRFSDEQIMKFLDHPTIAANMETKRNALVFDFMRDRYKKTKSMCVIIDLPCDEEASLRVMQFFCEAVNRCKAEGNLRMECLKSGDQTRVILAGAEEYVMQIIREYDK